MLNRHLILSTLIIGLLMGMIGSIYDPNLNVFAQREVQNQNKSLLSIEILDRELVHVNKQFSEIKAAIEKVNDKIDKICDDMTNVKVKAAESGGIYGGGAAIIVYFGQLLIKGLWNRKKNGK